MRAAIRGIHRWVGWALLLAVSGRTSIGAAPEPPSTIWLEMDSARGSVSLDGTLRLSLDFPASETLRALGFKLQFHHEIDRDAFGRARSLWRVSGLRTAVVPTGRDQLSWIAPDGQTHRFPGSRVGLAYTSFDTRRELIRRPAPGQIDIREPDGTVWHYRSGSLFAIDHPAVGTLQVGSHGVWIDRISAAEEDLRPPVMAVDYDEAGCPVSLRFDASAPHRFEWNSARQLTAWIQPDGQSTTLSYSADLLSTLTRPGEVPTPVRWESNPGNDRGDSRWPAPWHLSAFGAERYDFRFSSRGFVLLRHFASGGTPQTVRTVFNPRRLILRQEMSGDTRLARLKLLPDGRLAPATIATPTGHVIERYVYDDHGRLVRLERNGRPDLSLNYDQLGRLVVVEPVVSP